MNEVRDLLYLDFHKAASIWSQFEGGLRERLSVTQDDGKGQKAGVRFGIPKVIDVDLGADYSQKRSILETKVLHHDILNRVDEELSKRRLVFDFSESVERDESSHEVVRSAIGKTPYIKATGQCVIEDYPRILGIAEKFNDVAKFISKCGAMSIKTTPEFVALQEAIQSNKKEAEAIKDKNQRARTLAEVKRAEAQLNALTETSVDVPGVDPWLIDGIKLFINTFMKTRINFRTYPLHNCPSMQVICNLNRECFIDQDVEHLLYGYGNKPNVDLTVFGLITSLPSQGNDRFDP